MMRTFHLIAILLVLAFAAGTLISPNPATAASASEINRDVKAALEKLYAKSPSAKTLGEKAIGILVFPGIVKGGFIVGGNMVRGLSSWTERRPATTTPFKPRMVCRQGYKNTGMQCF